MTMVTLTTDIMFLLLTSMSFCCGEFYEGGPREGT
jgi:1,4-dihydroxy-2-naphthoate octaprenyltransferase